MIALILTQMAESYSTQIRGFVKPDQPLTHFEGFHALSPMPIVCKAPSISYCKTSYQTQTTIIYVGWRTSKHDRTQISTSTIFYATEQISSTHNHEKTFMIRFQLSKDGIIELTFDLFRMCIL
jgi:hypothetical protein